MIPDFLLLENFGSFIGRHTFTFPREPGLYFMWGDNQAEPRLGGNGAGKSTVWAALTWLFWGKTAAGLKAADTANWKIGKKTLVRLGYQGKAGPSFVTRTWSPNSWEWQDVFGNKQDLTKDASNILLEELRLEYSSFLQTVVMPQKRALFLDLDATRKAELFSDVMQLDRWVSYSNKASDRARSADTECRRLERELAAAEGRLEQALRSDHEEHFNRFEDERERKLGVAEANYEILLEAAEIYEKRLKQLQRDADERRAAYKLVKRTYDEQVQAAEGKTCSKCGQPLREHLPDGRDVSRLLKELEERDADVARARNELLKANQALDRLEEDVERVEQEVNPYKALQDAAAAEIQQHRADVHRLKNRLDAAYTAFSVASGWVRWFKEIRLAQIGEALTQLELEVNNELGALGLVDWALRFEVDRESKTGTIQRGFNVYVQSPYNDRQVPWESWSGGESQRLIVAAQTGLANLIRARTGATLKLEVWDEPTKGMSPQGVQDLLEALRQRALREQRPIWIVDHQTLGFNGFSGQAGVVKDSEGSHFTETRV